VGSKAVHGDCTLGGTEDWGKSGNGPASVVFECVDKRMVSHLSRYRSRSSSDIVGKFLYISSASLRMDGSLLLFHILLPALQITIIETFIKLFDPA